VSSIVILLLMQGLDGRRTWKTPCALCPSPTVLRERAWLRPPLRRATTPRYPHYVFVYGFRLYHHSSG